MPQLILRRIACRAVQVAIVAAGILVLLLVFSRQATAATTPPSTPDIVGSGNSVTSAVTSATSVVTLAVSAVDPGRVGSGGFGHSAAVSPGSPACGGSGFGQLGCGHVG